VREMWESMS